MSNAGLIVGSEGKTCIAEPHQGKIADVGDVSTLITEEEAYYSDGAKSCEADQTEMPEEVMDTFELHNYQGSSLTDKHSSPSTASQDGAGNSQQKAPSDTTAGEQGPSAAPCPYTTDKERRVYVGNLSYQVSWKDLKDYMRKCGSVVYADVLTEYNGMSKGCGVVEYSTKEEAQRAIKELNNTQLLGRSIFVREDREEESKFGVAHPRRGRYGRYPGAWGIQVYGNGGRHGYMYKGSAPGGHGWNSRNGGDLHGGYNNFYRRMYYYGRPYTRGDGGSRYGIFNGYRDVGYRQRSGGLHLRRNFYGPTYGHQGSGGRNSGQNGRTYYYGHRNYGANRGVQTFSGTNGSSASPQNYYKNYGEPYTGGNDMNANYVGGVYMNRDTPNMMHGYAGRGGYSADYSGPSGPDKYASNEYMRSAGGENRNPLYRS